MILAKSKHDKSMTLPGSSTVNRIGCLVTKISQKCQKMTPVLKITTGTCAKKWGVPPLPKNWHPCQKMGVPSIFGTCANFQGGVCQFSGGRLLFWSTPSPRNWHMCQKWGGVPPTLFCTKPIFSTSASFRVGGAPPLLGTGASFSRVSFSGFLANFCFETSNSVNSTGAGKCHVCSTFCILGTNHIINLVYWRKSVLFQGRFSNFQTQGWE